MRIQDPKSRNMAHTMSLSVFIAFKGTDFYIFIHLSLKMQIIIINIIIINTEWLLPVNRL